MSEEQKTWWDKVSTLTAQSALIVILVGAIFLGVPYLVGQHNDTVTKERELHERMWKETREDVNSRLEKLIDVTEAMRDELRRRNAIAEKHDR